MPLGTALLVAVATSAWQASTSQPADDPVGWYENDSKRVLIARGPSGGLRWLDFDGARFFPLVEGTEAGEYEARGDGGPRSLNFAPDAKGRSTLRWKDDAGAPLEARLADHPPYRVEDVAFESRSTRLVGSLLVPSGDEAQRAGCVLIQGSGDSDRDNVWAFTIAHHIALRGSIVLIPDKRGCGDSGGDWHAADFAMLADDALAGLAVVKRQPRVSATRLGVVGLSQGGWISSLAAQRSPDVRFAVTVSGSSVPPAKQFRHETSNDLRRSGLDDAAVERVLELLELGLTYARSMSESDWRAYVERRRIDVEGPLRPIVEAFPDDPAHWKWKWWHGVADFDPIAAWRTTRIPVLAIYGSEDEKDNVPVAESVRRWRELPAERVTVRVFEGSGHAIQDPSPNGKWLRADFLDTVADFVRAAR